MARITLKLDPFDRETAQRGWTTDAERARRTGVTRATISRIRRGIYDTVSVAFIAGTLAAMPDVPFEDLFTVVTDDQAQDEGAA